MRSKKVYLNTIENIDEARKRANNKLFDVLQSNDRPG